MAHMGQLGTDLMRAPGVQAQQQQAPLRAALQGRELLNFDIR